jgi:hypothetical protein
MLVSEINGIATGNEFTGYCKSEKFDKENRMDSNLKNKLSGILLILFIFMESLYFFPYFALLPHMQ